MKQKNAREIQKEGLLLLLDSSLRSIPFNVIVALLLATFLIRNHVSSSTVYVWFFSIVVVGIIRWVFSKRVLTQKIEGAKERSILMTFSLLTLSMGIAWGYSYFIFLPHLTELAELMIVLVFGGMCAGSIASLSVYLPAYYAYIFPMYIPLIIYNYCLFDFNRAIMATLFLLLVIMLSIVANMNKKLLHKTFQLASDKDFLINQLEMLSITDSLTGLFNRRHFKVILEEEYNRAKRSKRPLNLVAIDVDNFKLINDFFGHPYGDNFLIYTADVLKQHLQRSSDKVFRLGGDEFSAIIGDLSGDEVLSLCKALQDEFKKTYKVDDAQDLFSKITLSIGIAHVFFDCAADLENIIMAADKALYQAKNKTKNNIVLKELE